MKVAIGQRPVDGPWGGGNMFVAAIARVLEARGDTVAYDLAAPDIDVIVMTDPRARNPAVSFTPGAILRYLAFRNPRAVVVHRVNECDERKATRGMNKRLKLANYAADATVFIGSWLQGLDLWRRQSPARVILNGADRRIFHATGQRPWPGEGPLKIVTHHWGAHRLKGFDVFDRLDGLLAEAPWQGRLEFSYVGRLPADAWLANSRVVQPLSGAALADELRRHHVYLTASVNEPAGMHHVEGACCGLPILYRQSGALPEYCTGFGEPFTGPEDFEGALTRMMENHSHWQAKMPEYANTAERMAAGYIAFFDELMAKRDTIVARRRLWRSPLVLALNQVPW